MQSNKIDNFDDDPARFGDRTEEEILPKIEDLLFVNESGQLVNKKSDAKEDITYFWRRHQNTTAAITALCGLMLILIILGSMDIYFNKLFALIGQFFGIVTGFLFGLLSNGGA